MTRHLLTLLLLAAAAPAAFAQRVTDTLDVHPGDTIKVVVPASCTARCYVNIQGATAGTTIKRTLVRVTPRRRTATPVATEAPGPAQPGGGGQGRILFASDFSTNRGTARDAVQDGQRWPIFGGTGLEVVPSSGLDFPSPNVLRVTAVATRSGFGTIRREGMPVIAVGESRYYRVYFRAAFRDGLSDNQTHPIQDGSAGSQINWELAVFHNQGGTGKWTLALQVHSNNQFADFRWYAPTLTKNVTYRLEWRVQRLSEDTFTMQARVYNASGRLLYDDDDFRNEGRTRTLADRPVLRLNKPASLGGLNAGLNGLAGSEWGASTVYAYQGAFAICTDWCGPWRQGEGR